METFTELSEVLAISINKLKKLGEQNDCYHAWDGDDCSVCGLHIEF